MSNTLQLALTLDSLESSSSGRARDSRSVRGKPDFRRHPVREGLLSRDELGETKFMEGIKEYTEAGEDLLDLRRTCIALWVKTRQRRAENGLAFIMTAPIFPRQVAVRPSGSKLKSPQPVVRMRSIWVLCPNVRVSGVCTSFCRRLLI